MRSRRLILCLICLTLVVIVLAASAKLRSSKYDRVEVGMSWVQVNVILGANPTMWPPVGKWELDEGSIRINYEQVQRQCKDGRVVEDDVVKEERIKRRGPLERLAWLAGWR